MSEIPYSQVWPQIAEVPCASHGRGAGTGRGGQSQLRFTKMPTASLTHLLPDVSAWMLAVFPVETWH